MAKAMAETRRIFPYPSNLDDFISWLDAKGERVDILPTMERKGLEDVIKVQGNNVSLIEKPENLRVGSIASPEARIFEDT